MSNITQPNETLKRIKAKWFILTLLFFSIYATLRYIIFKGVDPGNLACQVHALPYLGHLST